MKFARNFQDALVKGEYPQEWIDTAISYRKLKKCIKKVQLELRSLGLDHETLDILWQHVEGNSQPGLPEQEALVRSLKYSLQDGDAMAFTPKLTIAIDPRDGSPLDAWISPQTRVHLRELVTLQETKKRQESGPDSKSGDVLKGPVTTDGGMSSKDAPVKEKRKAQAEVELIEVPLTADSEFFHLLRREMLNLERLQKRQKDQLESEIVKLGRELASMKTSSSKKSKANVEVWREIFRLYTESQIFYSSNEQTAGSRDVQHAQTQLELFNKSLVAQQESLKKLDGGAKEALDRFLQINLSLLQFLRFQDINRTALTKIMKKFDKRTALRAQESVSQSLSKAPFIAQDLAKAASFTISEELLLLIPQLDDYLCPVCFTISYKPIRLRCNHVFCIRCLIVLQRAEQDHCPLCREEVILEATDENVDQKLMAFLKANFPKETKAKQKANEAAIYEDKYGGSYEDDHKKCTIM